RPGRDLGGDLPAIDLRPSADEIPEEDGEAAELPLDLQERLGVADRGADLQTVPHDPRVAEQLRDLSGAIPRHAPRIEPIERLAVVPALSEDGLPAQARLGSFQDEHLEEVPVVV